KVTCWNVAGITASMEQDLSRSCLPREDDDIGIVPAIRPHAARNAETQEAPVIENLWVIRDLGRLRGDPDFGAASGFGNCSDASDGGVHQRIALPIQTRRSNR